MRSETVKIFYPETTVKRKLPVNIKPGDERLFGELSYTINESRLVKFNNVLVTDLGIIIRKLSSANDFVVCYDSDFSKYEKRYILKVQLFYKKEKHGTTGEKFLLAFDNYSGPNGFFHWIADGLTKLIELQSELNEYTLLVPWYFKNQKQYIQTLNLFPHKKKYYISEKSAVQLKELYAPEFIAESGNFHPQNINKLRNYIWEKCEVRNNIKEPSRIYITRKNATRRFVLNEEEVIRTVKEFGYEIISIEDYDFNDQVNLIYNASHLISIHGAALTHIAFMREGSTILELRKNNDNWNNAYFNLANAANVTYYYQLCGSQTEKENANSFNLIVDTSELQKNLFTMHQVK
jgi:hypothetical protein